MHHFKIFCLTTSDLLRSSLIEVLYTKSWWNKASVTSPQPTVDVSCFLIWLANRWPVQTDALGQFITSEMGHWLSGASPSIELHNSIEEARFSMCPRDLKSRYPTFLRAIKESVRWAFRSLSICLTQQIYRNYQKNKLYMTLIWLSFALNWVNSSHSTTRTSR